jgi:hypothetical protein
MTKKRGDLQSISVPKALADLVHGHESDRVVVIVGAAFLDAILERLIASFLIEGKESKEMFEYPNVFGAFGARIKVAYVLGLLTREEYHDLKIIKDVRNDFAHSMQGGSFSEQSVADQCSRLKYSKRSFESWRQEGVPDTPRYRFLHTLNGLCALLFLRSGRARKERRRVPEDTAFLFPVEEDKAEMEEYLKNY